MNLNELTDVGGGAEDEEDSSCTTGFDNGC
jgi:hypothetical protein